MFGTYRTMLALMVLIGHLFGPSELGHYAVFGFYMLSGLLMTLIMHETYGYTLSGRLSYGFNRILRIYPTYYVAIGLTLVCIFFWGESATRQYHAAIFLPDNLRQILRHIFILFSINSSPRLSPPTWALTVEVFFYVLICLGISKTRRFTLVWVGLSFVYVLITYLLRLGWQERYFSIYAASLPFSLGSYIYFLTAKIKFYLPSNKFYSSPLFLTSLLWINFTVSSVVEVYLKVPMIFNLGFYLNLIINFLLISSLICENTYPTITKAWDREIGTLSYPIYLIHWQIGLILTQWLFKQPHHYGLSLQGFINMIISLPVTCIVAYLIVLVVEKPIDKIRSLIRTRSMQQVQ